jgi:anti-anti-sigma factor
VSEDTLPVRWAGRQAIMTLPEHIDAANVGQIREELLGIINRGAAVLIADMTATVSCDYGGADALMRAYQRASVSGTQLRVVVTAPVVRRVLEVSGLDRLISIYPDLGAATAARTTAVVVPLPRRPERLAGGGPASRRREKAEPRTLAGTAVITPAVLWNLVDALGDGVALVGDDGELALANRRLEQIFGYQRGELAGHKVESLIPANLRAAHIDYRAGYAQDRCARPMSTRPRLVGLRKDGATVPVEISLSPVPTRAGFFTLAVVRDMTATRQRRDLADLARAAAADHDHGNEELLDEVVRNLLRVGHSLQTAPDLAHEDAMQQIAGALRCLDETIGEIRSHMFAARNRQPPAEQASADRAPGKGSARPGLGHLGRGVPGLAGPLPGTPAPGWAGA